MNQPNKQAAYTGKFVRTPEPRKRRKGLLVLLILILVLTRTVATGLKVLSIADYYIGGDRTLIYGNIRRVELGDSLKTGDGSNIPIINHGEQVPSGESDYIIQRDNGKRIEYHGHTYELNENLVTILFLGIDRHLTPQELAANEKRGQVDTLVLVGIDTLTGETKLLNISRETYAQVDVYSVNGRFIETRYEQIATAFGHADGKVLSCENTIASLSRLFYGLPISRYFALDMDGIQAANEAVGGVTVKSLLDYPMPDGSYLMREGEMIELHGLALDRYIRNRSHYSVDANSVRMERQMQYISEFSKLVVRKAKKDLSFPSDLFSSLSTYMITDLGIPDVTFLSSCYLDNGATFTFRTINGTYGTLNGSACYYLDEVDLFESVLDIFYTRTK